MDMETIWWVIRWEGKEEEWGKCAGIKKYDWLVQNTQGVVKNSAGDGVAKEWA